MKLLDLAARLAMGGSRDRNYKLACIVCRSDGAMTWSLNELTEKPNPRSHAEARALRKADWGSTIYVARVTHDGTWAISKPCPRCQALIKNMGVAKVYYTIGPGEYGVWYPQRDKKPS